MKNYYEILEVSNKASKEIIEKAYKVLAKKYHPDIYTGIKKQYAEERIKEINEAYKILSDDFLREQYDNELKKEKQINIERKINNNIKEKSATRSQKEDSIKEEQSAKNAGILELVKQVISTLSSGIKNIKSVDMMALGLTILVMVVLGLILWILPFTHDFIYNNFIGVFK